MTYLNIAREDLATNLLKTLSTFDSKFLLETWRGMPATSKHSLLEYWAFTQHCLSISITLLLTSVLTCLTINLQISSRASVFTLTYCSTLFWSDKVIPVRSFLTIYPMFPQCKLSLLGFKLQIKVTVGWKVDSIYLH